ncbi:MAG: hypothetical protein ACK5HY_15375 [Parahaliea sp.]
MLKKLMTTTAVVAALGTGAPAMAQSAPICDDIEWSSSIVAEYPDIVNSCQGVYEKDGELYAKAIVEVQRVRGNRITFRPLHTDGSKGPTYSIQVPREFRAHIAGRDYRASELARGQNLNVYLPHDRWALAVEEEGDFDIFAVILIEEEVVEMPDTASPLFLFGLAGGALVSAGGLITLLRRRRG